VNLENKPGITNQVELAIANLKPRSCSMGMEPRKARKKEKDGSSFMTFVPFVVKKCEGQA
jgi:hypothetical protein